MDFFSGMIAVITGFFLGALAVFLFSRAQKAQAVAAAQSQVRSETSALKERLSLKEQEIDDSRQRESELSEVLEQLRTDLHQETAARSAAVEKASRVPQLEAQLRVMEGDHSSLIEQLSDLKSENRQLQTLLEEQHRLSSEKLALLQDASQSLRDAFKALSSEALQSNNQAFLELAKTTLEKFQSEAKGDLGQRQKEVENLVSPIKESLDRYDRQIQAIEKSRHEAYGSITQQVESLLESQQKLEQETGNLVRALRTPHVRGRWGEMTLRRVVELAGMVEHCDFVEQESLNTESGRLRPDMIIKLPGGKHVVIDSKVPLQAYLEALEATDEQQRRSHLQHHAKQIRVHLQNLSKKAYWDQLETTPEFVILFIPSESFYSAAIEQEPELLEEGINQRVILSTPATLIALLRAVAYGWRQERVAENAQVISELGKSLYERLAILARHLEEMGRHLERSVAAYNRAVGSVESRVLIAARRFKELGAAAQGEIPELSQVEKMPRSMQSTRRLALTTEKKEVSGLPGPYDPT